MHLVHSLYSVFFSLSMISKPPPDISSQISKVFMTNVKTRRECNHPVQTGGQAGKRYSIREQKMRLVKAKSDAGDRASPHVVTGWICISADKPFSSETAFTEPFRYTSRMKKWVWPSLYCVNSPSFTQDTTGFISPQTPPSTCHEVVFTWQMRQSCCWWLKRRKKEKEKLQEISTLET